MTQPTQPTPANPPNQVVVEEYVATPTRHESQATQLAKMARDAEIEFFHAPDKTAYALLPVRGHFETVTIDGREMREWLAHRYFAQRQVVAGNAALKDAANTLAGIAVNDEPEVDVHLRLAEVGGRIYLDLADRDRRVIEIDSNGWRVAESPPVRFRRSRRMLPLPLPVPGGTPEQLWALLGVCGDTAKLVTAWLLAALRPTGPYPLLELDGEAGSGKSTRAKMLRDLIDPQGAGLRAAPKELQDLMVAAKNSWIVAMDNMSYLPHWLSDGLCRLSTGGGFGARTLYTNDEETTCEATRPVIINGISPVVCRGDLLDRTLLVSLPSIPSSARRTEKELWAEFEAARPALLGVLLSAVQVALRRLPDVQLVERPRMADFAHWISAAGPAFGGSGNEMLEAYARSRDEGDQLAIDGIVAGRELLTMLESLTPGLGGIAQWAGTATQLRVELERRRSFRAAAPPPKGWPADGTAMSRVLTQLTPNLRSLGWAVERTRGSGGNRTRTVTITRTDPPGSGGTQAGTQHTARDATGTQVTPP